MGIFRPLNRRYPYEPGPRLAEVIEEKPSIVSLVQDYSNRVRRGAVLQSGFTLDDGSSAVPFRRIVQVREVQDRARYLLRQGKAAFTGFILDDGSSAPPPQVGQIVTVRGLRITYRGQVLQTGFRLDDGSSAAKVQKVVTVRGLRAHNAGRAVFTGFKLDDGSSEVTRPASIIQELSNRIRRGIIRLGQQVKDEPAPVDRIGGRVAKVQDLVSRVRPGAIYWIPQPLDDGSSAKVRPASQVREPNPRYHRGQAIQGRVIREGEPAPDRAGLPPELSKEAFDRARLLRQGKILWGSQILDDGTSPTLPDVREIREVKDSSPLNRLLPRGGRVIWARSVRPDIDAPQLARKVVKAQDLTNRFRAGMIMWGLGGAREAPIPPAPTTIITPEGRVYAVPYEDRVYSPFDDRIYEVKYQDRTFEP